MLRRISRASTAGLLACLAGCADRAASTLPAAMTPPPPLARAASVDGTYNGLMQLVSGPPIACGTSNVFALVVQNNAFQYMLNQPQVPWQPQRTFSAVISPDGSFRAGTDTAYISGTVSQGHIQGQIVGDSCQFQFEADAGGTF